MTDAVKIEPVNGRAVGIKCPKCRGNTLRLFECLETSNIYRVIRGEVESQYLDESFPTPIGFNALCDCGHRWTPKQKTGDAVVAAGDGVSDD